MSTLHIAVLMMVKNEHQRIHVSLESIKNFADSLVIYDTGSTDNTIEILQSFSSLSNIPLRLKEGTFENFSVSRNVSLDFADSFSDVDYILLMDVNDELRNGDELRKFIQAYHDKDIDKKSTGFLLTQEWLSGKYTKYVNVRFVKAREGWRYKGRVHEWIERETKEDNIFCIPNVTLFQDRTQDDDKSGKRFPRDYKLLMEDHKENPTETRTIFYLAQTCDCLDNLEEALKYYSLRTQYGGFEEERFHSYLRCGHLTQRLNRSWDESMAWYMKAIQHTVRAEPYIAIAKHYKNLADKFQHLPPTEIEHHQVRQCWELSFHFIRAACEVPYPENAMLFVDRDEYDYQRWHLMSIIAWYAHRYADGKFACLKTLQSEFASDLDRSNLQYYISVEENESKNKEDNTVHTKKHVRNRKNKHWNNK